MDLRLLDLDHRAAGVGQFVLFLVERVGDRENAIRDALVVRVLHREGDDLGPMVPNLTGFSVMRCATFHIAVYCRLPRAIGPVITGMTRDSR